MSLNELIQKSDQLQEDSKLEENFNFLKDAYDQGQKDPQLLWRYARAYFDLSDNASDKSKAFNYIEGGLKIAQEAKETGPDVGPAYKWYGILVGVKGDHLSTKEKISNAYVIKESLMKANELAPGDPTTLHALAKWCFSVSNVGWLERQAASAFFATPPTSTYEEAEKYELEAKKAAPNLIHVNLFLGDIYAAQKKYKDAKAAYETAAAGNAVTLKQKKDKEDAAAKAKKM